MLDRLRPPGGVSVWKTWRIVGWAGQEMFADATQVVLMRDGTRTVLSMQNRYDGPIKDFAMVIPVPVVLQEQNVKTLDDAVEAQNCVDCHMPRKEDGRRSHRFTGGHATLAAAIGSQDQLDALRGMVEGAATISLGGWGVDPSRLDPPTRITSGQRILFDVVVFNEKVGHRFPGGAMDLRDTRVELTLQDASGAVLVRSGAAYAEGVETPTPHPLRSLLANADGAQVDNHRVHAFNTPVFNHTIDAREAAVVRYAWDAQQDIDLAGKPLTLAKRLLQRRLMPALATSACEDLQTERGRDFQRFTREYTGLTIDPCVAQPILEVSRDTRKLGETGAEQDWRHYFHYGASIFDNHPAYVAAQTGLDLEPRDPGLLRSQSLSLRKLDASPEWIATAQKAFLDFKDDEAGARIRALCSDNSPDCLLERRPLQVHVLKAP